jgi:hypothetical protein
MPKSKSRKKRSPKRVLALPDLEQAKTAVLNSLTSARGQRTYEHLGHVSIQTTERYLGCKQRLRCAVNDRLGESSRTPLELREPGGGRKRPPFATFHYQNFGVRASRCRRRRLARSTTHRRSAAATTRVPLVAAVTLATEMILTRSTRGHQVACAATYAVV